MATTLVKSNAVTVGQLWQSYSHLRLQVRRDSERVMDMNRTHSYTSLSDVMGSATSRLPASSSPAVLRGQCSTSHFQSFHDIHSVHMKNPLVEKAARYYLATANFGLDQHGQSSMLSTGSLSFFYRILSFPFQNTQIGFHTLFGGARAWIKQQLYIKN